MQYLNGKRYYTMAQYCRDKFGGRIIKIPLWSGMSCPNRDGTKGTGGCTFCAEKNGSGDGFELPSLYDQYCTGLAAADKWKGAKPVAYFQNFTNTYAPVNQVEDLLNEALNLPNLAGIRLATRADCIDAQMADLLARFAQKTVLEIELGLQTVHDKTAEAVNRGHSFVEFCQGFRHLKKQNLYACVHLINGLPDETPDMMIESAKVLAELHPSGVKLHMLHLMSGTRLAQAYLKDEFPLLSQQEYVAVVCHQLRCFHPETVIERLTGDGDRNTLIAPLWTLNKRRVLNAIDGMLAQQNIWQGDFWEDR